MLLHFFKSKIHRATVTGAELLYKGSISIDEDLMEASHLYENERVTIVNCNNGERFDTYVIKGERGAGKITLHGPSARKVQVGDIIIIISFCILNEAEHKNHTPKIIFMDEQNRITN